MTLEQEGAYIRLVAYCWQHGDIPRDPKEAARLIGKGASTTLAESVLSMFIPAQKKGRLTHDRLEAQRAHQEAWRAKSSQGGRKSAEIRSKGGSTVVQPPLQPKGNTPYSVLRTPSPVPEHEREQEAWNLPECNGNPTLREVLSAAELCGLAAWKAEDWFNEMQGCGWLDFHHRPIQDWRAVMTRVRVKWESDGRPPGPPKTRVSATGERPKTPLDLKTIIQAKEALAASLRHKFCSDTAIDSQWSDNVKRQEFFALKKQIKELNNQLSNMA